ncbi:uncharacterized protein EDB91DRAFT_1085189 [Suillus paluster]|uniref:uncharacterized protein n=1 Tax=Suillus paluster TaxID=48578 RepID=UPI001B86BEF8|nr:uncharacterized protein EDB91DRAFT_1085189 [Suillus paluster]KAG1731069.1 hypothetical protein EDB91DRAFT_1085189 [Suillus paluster]
MADICHDVATGDMRSSSYNRLSIGRDLDVDAKNVHTGTSFDTSNSANRAFRLYILCELVPRSRLATKQNVASVYDVVTHLDEEVGEIPATGLFDDNYLYVKSVTGEAISHMQCRGLRRADGLCRITSMYRTLRQFRATSGQLLNMLVWDNLQPAWGMLATRMQLDLWKTNRQAVGSTRVMIPMAEFAVMRSDSTIYQNPRVVTLNC